MTAYFLRLYTCSVKKKSEVTKIFKFFYLYQKFLSISFFIRIKSRTFITPSPLKSIQSELSSISQRYLIIDTISFAPYFLGVIAFRSGSIRVKVFPSMQYFQRVLSSLATSQHWTPWVESWA